MLSALAAAANIRNRGIEDGKGEDGENAQVSVKMPSSGSIAARSLADEQQCRGRHGTGMNAVEDIRVVDVNDTEMIEIPAR